MTEMNMLIDSQFMEPGVGVVGASSASQVTISKRCLHIDNNFLCGLRIILNC